VRELLGIETQKRNEGEDRLGRLTWDVHSMIGEPHHSPVSSARQRSGDRAYTLGPERW
jgi:hypothetical protein